MSASFPRVANPSTLRTTGWILAILGISTFSIVLPVSAWFADDTSFERHVGWANILAFTVGGIGVVLVLLEKVGILYGYSEVNIQRTIDHISKQVLREENRLLAHLLGTDAPDGRPAQTLFTPIKKIGTKTSSRKLCPRQLSEITDFFTKETRGRMVVLGAPGTGKTVLAGHIAVELIKRRQDNQSNGTVTAVPVLFNLPSWNPHKSSLADWLTGQIADRFHIRRKLASHLVEDRHIIPLFDGLDEMDSESNAPHRAEAAVDEINRYIAYTANAQLVVVSRSGRRHYKRLTRKIRDADGIILEELRQDQIIDYIQAQCDDESDAQQWHPVIKDLRSHNSKSRQVLNTPWRLTSAITFYRDGGDPHELLPLEDNKNGEKRQESEQDYVERIRKTLIAAFLASKICLHFPKRRVEDILDQLFIIAYTIRVVENKRGRLQEIVPHEWWKQFSRRTRFAILTTHAALVYNATTYVIPAANLFDYDPYGPGIHWMTVIGITLNSATIRLYVLRRCLVLRPVQVNLNLLRMRPGGMVAIALIALSLSAGVVTGILYNWLYGVIYGTTLAILTFLLMSHSIPAAQDDSDPFRPLSSDLKHALMLGTTAAVFASVYYMEIYGQESAILFGLMILIGIPLASSYIRYYITVAIGRTIGLPIRFGRFLKDSNSAGILRVSGGGYQFRHREIQEFLDGSL